VEQNFEMAKELYELAISKGNFEFSKRVGVFYETGMGCEQNREKANEFFGMLPKEKSKEINYFYWSSILAFILFIIFKMIQ
jgi:TPR repeat protein